MRPNNVLKGTRYDLACFDSANQTPLGIALINISRLLIAKENHFQKKQAEEEKNRPLSPTLLHDKYTELYLSFEEVIRSYNIIQQKGTLNTDQNVLSSTALEEKTDGRPGDTELQNLSDSFATFKEKHDKFKLANKKEWCASLQKWILIAIGCLVCISILSASGAGIGALIGGAAILGALIGTGIGVIGYGRYFYRRATDKNNLSTQIQNAETAIKNCTFPG